MGKSAPSEILGTVVLSGLLALGVSQAQAGNGEMVGTSAHNGRLTRTETPVAFSDDGELFIMGQGAEEWFSSIVSEQALFGQAIEITVNDGCTNSRCIGTTNTNGCTNGICFTTIEI